MWDYPNNGYTKEKIIVFYIFVKLRRFCNSPPAEKSLYVFLLLRFNQPLLVATTVMNRFAKVGYHLSFDNGGISKRHPIQQMFHTPCKQHRLFHQ